MKEQNFINKIVITAMMIALATVLNQFAIIQFPFGGGVTVFSQVPIIALGFIFGPVWGLIGGFGMSFLQLLFGLSNFTYVKGLGTYIIVALFDYIVPYTILGLGCMFKGKLKNIYAEAALGALCVSFIRFLCHWFSGATVWGEWMPEEFLSRPMTSPWIYSALYNGLYMLPEAIVTVIGIIAFVKLVLPAISKNDIANS